MDESVVPGTSAGATNSSDSTAKIAAARPVGFLRASHAAALSISGTRTAMLVETSRDGRACPPSRAASA